MRRHTAPIAIVLGVVGAVVPAAGQDAADVADARAVDGGVVDAADDPAADRQRRAVAVRSVSHSTTALTLLSLDRGSIDSADQLRGRTVASVQGTTAPPFIRRNGGRLVTADDIDDAIAMVEAGEAEAVVFDRPILQYHLEQSGSELLLSDASYEPVGYGFVFPIDGPLVRETNITLLELGESGRADRIREEWIGL